MNNQVPECLRQVIAALDIIVLFIYLAASYLPFIYRSWNYKKGIIIRRDIWIATLVLVISAIRMTGMICFIMYYILGGRGSGMYSVTLGLRVMLALTISPLDARVARWAFKTLKWVRKRKMPRVGASAALHKHRDSSAFGRPGAYGPHSSKPASTCRRQSQRRTPIGKRREFSS